MASWLGLALVKVLFGVHLGNKFWSPKAGFSSSQGPVELIGPSGGDLPVAAGLDPGPRGSVGDRRLNKQGIVCTQGGGSFVPMAEPGSISEAPVGPGGLSHRPAVIRPIAGGATQCCSGNYGHWLRSGRARDG